MNKKLLLPILVLSLTGCNEDSHNVNTNLTRPANAAPAFLSPKAALGKKIFFDTSLSASGQQSCATCHVPERAHAADDNLPVPMGGPTMATQGFRNASSLNYLQLNPAFAFDGEGTPVGGFMRDGREATFASQARGPFLGAHEMANTSIAEVVSRLASASYAREFEQLFGPGIFGLPELAFQQATQAIATYEMEDPAFRPFNSKYDYFLQGKAQLTPQELRGLALFNNPAKGNCAACHPSTSTEEGVPPLFTDFTYDNLGVPRNPAISANSDPDYFDLGLCGPDRQDLADRQDLCGAFKVPTLRNIALTAPYFHNGVFDSLRDVVAFYVRRDTHPEEWYPIHGSTVEKFNDLPPAYRQYVNTTEAPYNRHPGDQPALNAQEIDDVVAFLNTLTDGYQP